MAVLHSLYSIFVDSKLGWLMMLIIDFALFGGSMIAFAVVRKAAYQSFSGGSDLTVGFFLGLMLVSLFNALIYSGAFNYQAWKERRNAQGG